MKATPAEVSSIIDSMSTIEENICDGDIMAARAECDRLKKKLDAMMLREYNELTAVGAPTNLPS